MKKTFSAIAVLVFLSPALFAQSWSIGAGAGPFVFGKFVDRTFRLSNGSGSMVISTTTLSAKTRPGATLDLERNINSWLAIRAQGTFVDSPIRVGDKQDGVNLDAGKLDVTTISTPILVRFNRRGTFRFHIMGGPAYASYHVRTLSNAGNEVAVFSGTRNRWGAMAGAGVDWWLSDRFAIEGEISDIVTSSPFERADYPAGTIGLHIRRPHNVHTTTGIRYRF